MISALNNAAWYLRKEHQHWALKISQQSVYCMGWYKEWNETNANIFDTLFELQILTCDYFGASTTAVLMLKMRNLKKEYLRKIEGWKEINLDISIYTNSREFRKWIKSLENSVLSISRKTGVDRKILAQIISGKIEKVRGATVRKIIRNLDGIVKVKIKKYKKGKIRMYKKSIIF